MHIMVKCNLKKNQLESKKETKLVALRDKKRKKPAQIEFVSPKLKKFFFNLLRNLRKA